MPYFRRRRKRVLTLTAAWGSLNGMGHYNVDGSNGSVAILQAPEFLSEVEHPGAQTLEINADIYNVPPVAAELIAPRIKFDPPFRAARSRAAASFASLHCARSLLRPFFYCGGLLYVFLQQFYRVGQCPVRSCFAKSLIPFDAKMMTTSPGVSFDWRGILDDHATK